MIKAILLAAGQSKRIKSENKLTKLYKKKPLLNHSLKALHKSKVNKVIIVLGHQQNKVKKIIKKKNDKSVFLTHYSIGVLRDDFPFSSDIFWCGRYSRYDTQSSWAADTLAKAPCH